MQSQFMTSPSQTCLQASMAGGWRGGEWLRKEIGKLTCIYYPEQPKVLKKQTNKPKQTKLHFSLRQRRPEQQRAGAPAPVPARYLLEGASGPPRPGDDAQKHPAANSVGRKATRGRRLPAPRILLTHPSAPAEPRLLPNACRQGAYFPRGGCDGLVSLLPSQAG